MAGFDNDVVYAANVDFRGVKPIAGQVTADGQLLIGSTASPNIKVGSLASANGSLTYSVGSGTIDISLTDRTFGSGQTIGAVTADILTINLGATPATFAFYGRVTAYESTTPAGGGALVRGTFTTTGAAASLVEDTVIGSIATDAALAAISMNWVQSGNSAILRVTGVVGLTVNWNVTCDQSRSI